MHIYVACLKNYIESRGRLVELNKKLKQANLKRFPIRLIGVDARDLKEIPSGYLDGEFNDGYPKYLIGAKGCALSHIEIYKDIKKNNIQDDILVLEDDADIHRYTLKILENRIPKEYDIFFLHTIDHNNYSSKYNINYSKNVKKISIPSSIGIIGSHTYILNGRNIDKIIKNTVPFLNEVDVHLFLNKKLDVYCYNSKLGLSGQVGGVNQSYRLKFDEDSRIYKINFKDENNLIYIDKNYTFDIKVHKSLVEGIYTANMFLASLSTQEGIKAIQIGSDKITYDDKKNDMRNISFKIPQELFDILKKDLTYQIGFHRKSPITGKTISIYKNILKT